MIDTLYQDSIDKSLDDQLQRPKSVAPPPPNPFTFSGIGKAATVGAVGGGAAQAIGSGADILGAFGQVLGASDVSSQGMFSGFRTHGLLSGPTPAERTQREQANTKIQTEGVDYSSDGGDLFRQRADDLMPNPQTAHASEMIVAGVGKSVVKAIGHAALFGPAAPISFALDEGLTESDRLKHLGVDLETRTKVGAVTGAVAGASLVLPVAAPGALLKTTGLVTVAGPGGFVTQNIANHAILEHAGYKDLANQYDPLDPVGLALSTLVPAVFGYMGYRGGKPVPSPKLRDVAMGMESGGQDLDANGQVLTSPKGAKGKMQVMDATNLDPGFGVRPAADGSLAERARVGGDYLDAMVTRYGSEDKALAAYNAGPGALDNALAAATKKGTSWLAELPAETQAYVRKGMAKLGPDRVEHGVRTAISDDPDVVMAARVNQVNEAVDAMRLTPDDDLAGMNAHIDALQRAHDQLARGDDVHVLDLLPQDRLNTARMIDALGRDTRDSAAPVPELIRAVQADMTPPRRANGSMGQEPPTVLARGADVQPELMAKPATPATAAATLRDVVGNDAPHIDAATPASDSMAMRNPDRPVLMDHMDEKMPKAQFMEMVRREAESDTKDAQLLQVAAECFLQQA
jgi:hypothetical protein